MAGFLPDRIPDPSKWGPDQVTELITKIIDVATGLAGAVAVVYLVIGGFQYFTSMGDEEKAAEGRKTITWAIIGIVIIFISRLAITYVWHLVAPEIPAGSTPGTNDFPDPIF